MTVRVILDTNFLFIPSEFKIDVFEAMLNRLNQRFEPVLLSTNYDEMRKMAQKAPPKLQKQVALALKLTEKCRIVHVEKKEEETNDDVVLRMAALWRSAVATNDRELRRKLRARNVPVIFLRGKSQLELEGAL